MISNQPTFCVIGAGKFGKRAVERLYRKSPGARFIVVDQNLEILKGLSHFPAERVCQEGASYLVAHLDSAVWPEWIIPAVPIHLAFEWVRLKMLDRGLIEIIPVPSELESILPNPTRGTDGQLFVSYADFVCPDNCTEPLDQCTFTGKPRQGKLYERLEEVSFQDFTPVVIRSRQLAPGVGGYRPEVLQESLRRIRTSRGPVLYSTACVCHGVVHAFNLLTRNSHRLQ